MTPIALVSTAFAVDYLNEAQAQKVLFKNADEFIKKSIKLTDQQISKIKELSGTRQKNGTPLIWEARKKNKILGYFFIDEVVGKHEYITYAMALDTENKVLGMEIMSYRETHGGEIKELSWRQNFIGKKISDPFQLDVDVPNITGATLSSRNVLDGVKRLLTLKKLLVDEKIL